MKTPALLLLLSLGGGCVLVPCNHAFPTAEWYWSADAKACRKEHVMENQWREQIKAQDAAMKP